MRTTQTVSRTRRQEAGIEIRSATDRLMDGLLIEENRCFSLIAGGMQTVADEVARRVRARYRAAGRRGVLGSIRDLVPSEQQVASQVLPPIGDLLATTRERTLVVVRRQLRACESSVSTTFTGVSATAAQAAAGQAPDLERDWYERAAAECVRSVRSVGSTLGEQAEVWASRNEPVEHLVARWTSLDVVRLPRSPARGAVWQVRVVMNEQARNASVAVTNGLLLAGMDSWNQIAAASA